MITLLILSLLIQNAHADTSFSEAAWARAVSACDSSMLYAPHVAKGKFFNPWMAQPEHDFFSVFKSHVLGKAPGYTREEEEYLPPILPLTKKRIEEHGQGDFIVWIGHSTFLIRLNGAYFVTDPIMSERAVIIKRKSQPAMTVQELNTLAPLTVLLSHNHHDHLDRSTMKALPASTRVFAPMGLQDLIRDMNRKRVAAMDWWETRDAGNGVTIYCLPAQHWSLRLLNLTNTSLWCSYMIVTDKVVIYFGGDSGYFIGYREFAKRFPKIDYALLPMGAYRPRWFMHYSHLDPAELLKASADLNARVTIPMHWGAFKDGEEPVGFPALDLRRLMAKDSTAQTDIRMPALGEIINLF